MDDIYKLGLALLLGAAIGLERKINDHTAGIHTHAIVSVGAALFIMLGERMAGPAETARVASQVVMGVGFLSGAVIIRDGTRVRGLNTAVTVWCSSAIGAIVGSGAYPLGAEGAATVIVGNALLHLIEHRSGWFDPAPEADKFAQPATLDEGSATLSAKGEKS